MTSRVLVIFALTCLLTGCDGRHAGNKAAHEFSPGAISGAFGATLYSEPGAQPVATASSDLALVVAKRSHQGKSWSRLICADGRSGWTDRTFGPATSVVVSSVDSEDTLLNRSPDDDEIDSAATVDVPKGTAGIIVGASNTERAESMVDLMIPPRLNRTLMPWLQLRFGEVEGFAPLKWLAMYPAPGQEPIQAEEHIGWLQPPFVGLVSSVERIDGAAAALSMSDTRSQPKTGAAPSPAPTGKAVLEWAYRSPDGKHRLTIDARDAARDIAFAWPRGQLRVTVLEGSPRPVDVQIRDLDGDGQQEFVLETVSTYGDGFYSSLWVVRAPTQANARPEDVQSYLLSHSSGEDDKDADVSWSLDKNNRILIESVGVSTAVELEYVGGELRTR